MNKNITKKIFSKIKTTFLAGLFVTIPIVLTAYIVFIFFIWADGFFKNLIYKLTTRYIPGIGFLTTVIFIFLIGVLATNVLGKRLIKFWEKLLAQIPIVKSIYSAIKEITKTFSFYNKQCFLKAVLVEYPRKNLYVIGFVTSPVTDIYKKVKEKMVSVFVPTTPNPTNGILLIVPEEELLPLSISIEEAIKLVISGGIISPENKEN